jgi:acyl-CoA reductase-like NAD-dependent aldehyde dehydrogenase
MYSELALYIDGKWLNGEGRKGEDVINPATGKTLAHLPHASKADLDAALAAAEKGFALWKATSAYDRAKILRKAADLVRERHDHISKVMTQEQGKVYPESRAEVLTSADIIDWYAEEGRRAYGRVVPGRQKGVRQIVLQEPVGVVAAFTPWNFPTLTPVRKIAGALAAGCSIIIKASEETPGGCVELVKCFADAGVPAGVLNLVFGVPANVSEHLIPARAVKKISFTGSIPVGKHLAGLAAKGIKMGDGMEKGITMGPLANPRRLDAMESFVNDAKQRGGKIAAGGSRHGNQGFFFQPTVITDVPDDAKIMTEEPFGPVAPIVPFKTFDEVVERANSLPFGLAAYAFTSSGATATAIGDAMQSGMVGVNSIAISTPETPFGGIKESGYGSEGGMEGLQAYMNTKFISQS